MQHFINSIICHCVGRDVCEPSGEGAQTASQFAINVNDVNTYKCSCSLLLHTVVQWFTHTNYNTFLQ